MTLERAIGWSLGALAAWWVLSEDEPRPDDKPPPATPPTTTAPVGAQKEKDHE